MEMENTTTIDVLEYAVKMAEKGRNILAQSRGEEMTFTDESVFEATDTVLHPTGCGRNRVKSCPGDIFPGDNLLKLLNELDIAGADLSRSISKFERFLDDFPEWSQDGDEREILRVMRERQMEQRKDFVDGVLSPMLKRQYGIYRIFKDKTEESA